LDKQTIRTTLIKTRDSLDPRTLTSASHTICTQLMDLPEFDNAVIGSYLAVGHEVNLEHLHQTLWAETRGCYVPRILSRTDMEWAKLESSQDLTVGAYGIPTSLRQETVESPWHGRWLL
jgi:5,10-methenyltetrahydrofolate synthetase